MRLYSKIGLIKFYCKKYKTNSKYTKPDLIYDLRNFIPGLINVTILGSHINWDNFEKIRIDYQYDRDGLKSIEYEII